MYSNFIYSLSFFLLLVAVAVIGQNVYDYNTQVCCNGAVFNISTTKTTSGKNAVSSFQCCGKKYVQLKNSQICCNNAVVRIPSTIPITSASCCGTKVIDYNKGQCCGNNSYDYSTQVCCYDTGKVLTKPKSNCPGNLYFSCCGDQLVGPNQQCCNGVAINPSTTLITDPYGGYSYNTTSYCCSGGGIVQNPNKETCCDNGAVIPTIYGPNGGCCGGYAYNTSSQICCGKSIYSNTNYGFGCCGDKLYDYNSQICCNGNALPNNGGNLGCCGSKTYDYNKQLCCNNVVVPQTSPSLSCCYSYDSNPPIPIDRK